MAQIPPELLRARPDYYVRKLRAKAHKETVRSKVSCLRLHGAYTKEVKRIAKSDLTAVQQSRAYERIANEFCDRFEEDLRKRVRTTMDMAATEVQRIMNLCLPKGVENPGNKAVPPYWGREWKGQTPEERLARLRLRTVKRMRNVPSMSFYGATLKVPIVDTEEIAVEAWESTEAIAATLASNEPWFAFLVSQARNYESNEDVIDHYEFLATLD